MITDPEPPFSRGWERTPSTLTHWMEYHITTILNAEMWKRDMLARRIDSNPFSPYDLSIHLYGWADLIEGPEICRIDVERKPRDIFPKGGIPGRWIRGASFLMRKTRKAINYERDVYALFDSRERYPRVIWAVYGDIRDYGRPDFRGDPGKDYFSLLNEDHLNYGWASLVAWCDKLKNDDLRGRSPSEVLKLSGKKRSPEGVEDLTFRAILPRVDIETNKGGAG